MMSEQMSELTQHYELEQQTLLKKITQLEALQKSQEKEILKL